MNFSYIAMSNETRMLRPQNHEMEEKKTLIIKKFIAHWFSERNQ
jgi:hypothetical protein